MFRSRPLAAGISAVALVLLAAPAQARPIFHEKWHDADSEVFDDFCGIAGVAHAWDIHGISSATRHGSAQLAYFMDHFRGWESFTNPDTGDAYVHVFSDVVKDHQITDNGDGTLTIVSLGAGNDVWYASNGSLTLHDSGSVRWAALIDDNGTPGNPDDDEFLEDLGIIKPSTGTNDTDGRDFCDDFFLATS